MKAVRKKEVKLRDVGFVKQVGFKPGVKEKELWMYRVVNQKFDVARKQKRQEEMGYGRKGYVNVAAEGRQQMR